MRRRSGVRLREMNISGLQSAYNGYDRHIPLLSSKGRDQ